MRKDGSLFDARMYVSPLIDPKGQQTGWMTSMTNITEAKRIRDQLIGLARALHHRARGPRRRGLGALGAAGRAAVRQPLVPALVRRRRARPRAARRRRLLAAAAADGDDAVDGLGGLPTQELTDAGSDSREVFVEALQKWFDVRARYLQWTDGRLAQMLIATDITERRSAEAWPRSQAEKAQVTSRLVTMGEMASSVAHELNQPLTAITNYCNGMVTRVENDAIDKDDLIAALQKTSRQAERAGQIIHRIRAFVKRSEPQRQKAQAQTIVDDAVDLAGIELRRRNVAIQTYVAQRLPPLMVDPILIEQVVLNLLKNAAEAIDNAQLPPARRHIELRVVPRHTAEEGGVIEFSVTDKGPGLKDEVIAPHVRGVLLDQGRRPGHRPVACAARSSRATGAGSRRSTSTMATPPSAAASRSRCRSPPPFTRPLRPPLHEPDPQEGHRLRRRRRRGRARFAAVAARGQGLPRQVLRLGRVVPVALRPARGRLPDRRHPHGRHERPGAAGPAARAALAAAGRLHHRPRRRADGGDDDEEGRRGLHREAVQGRRAGRAGREDARARARRFLQAPGSRPAATPCSRA